MGHGSFNQSYSFLNTVITTERVWCPLRIAIYIFYRFTTFHNTLRDRICTTRREIIVRSFVAIAVFNDIHYSCLV